ncbi:MULTISPECIES: DUF928 domain-containing protein [Limnospira]|uniref:DUF928 domain-containing protein n=1 Tax=Limnospira maxima CS-328 TaxID=513049 RepID=B5VWJ2_LIMMA|nr:MULTISPECIES: DUF928 domain-containing protein [Limnospira]MDC0836951.1 DUF928 domain-containing protein [Limnoraphis robusta]QJB25457.1 DUF928 domain-containing protein [Limnospira fusiformis SAG 85.79]EDZ96218.1 protein of unknown function DUF928 [Limnospira maxima CS-328]MDT9277141.1 DUF928 domain-containing protein [Limnospira sp. PMC 737.11]QNH56447.1 MAG: DUF928 domain-containing protein [Limnospira indica BM01]
MVKTTPTILWTTLLGALCTQTIVWGSLVRPAIAYPSNGDVIIQNQPSPWLIAFDPPQRGVPGRRYGGGTRGEVCADYASLISLIPVSTMGLTAHEKPQLFFYLPVASRDTPIKLLVTKLPDSESPETEEIVIYRTEFQLDMENPGIVGIDLADLDGFPGLEVNQYYHWYLTILCDPVNQSVNPIVDGWIKRIDLDSDQIQTLEGLNGSDRLKFYTEKTLWYDMVAAFSELLSDNRRDTEVQQAWLELLRSENLEQAGRNQVRLYEQPFIPGSGGLRNQLRSD